MPILNPSLTLAIRHKGQIRIALIFLLQAYTACQILLVPLLFSIIIRGKLDVQQILLISKCEVFHTNHLIMAYFANLVLITYAFDCKVRAGFWVLEVVAK